ncbi:MAG: Unknown protein [uncultured Sulfurovum sp.]|uniref:Uncharacterized protein n=1 Tax=uncultured Sulfurovum sp. TaxID=269237 RepID=A0A6S6SUA4_9BACT|nr:MAG: Unknown protein [uncultured Sulfurovum sp.]
MFNIAKDIAFSTTAKRLLNRKLSKFGELSHLDFNSNKDAIELELLLKGETAPLQIRIKGYTVEEIEGQNYLTIQNIQTSREWMNEVVQSYVNEKKFKISKKQVRLIRRVL